MYYLQIIQKLFTSKIESMNEIWQKQFACAQKLQNFIPIPPFGMHSSLMGLIPFSSLRWICFLSILFLIGSQRVHGSAEIYDEEENFAGFEKTMDTALLFFHNVTSPHQNADIVYTVLFQSDNCHKCEPIKVFSGNESRTIKISSQFAWSISLWYHHQTDVFLDSIHYQFQEYGEYELTFEAQVSSGKLHMKVHKSGSAVPLPVIVTASICLAMSIIYKVFTIIRKRRKDANDTQLNLSDAEHAQPLLSQSPSQSSLSSRHSTAITGVSTAKHHIKPRLRSLDTFRGAALFFMVFVNYGGGGYWYFNHASWNGITFADLLFPWFVWIMGAAMPFSFSACEKKKQTKLQQLLSLLRRSLTLALLGMFLNNGHVLNYWRFPGVLQRFAVSYLIIGLIYLFVPKLGQKKERPLLATEPTNDPSDLRFGVNGDPILKQSIAESPTLPTCMIDHFSDIAPFIFEYLVITLLVMVWFLVTFLTKVPGCPTGYLGPGGLSGHWNCTGGAAAYIDKKIFGDRHLFDDPTCKDPGPGDVPSNYLCSVHMDPEGFLGNLTTIFLCFMGMQAGRTIKIYQTHRARFFRLLIHGLFWAAIGTGLCKASQNNGILPLNKNLWTFSFVAVAGGLAMILLALLFLLIDWFRWWKGEPFTFIGMNSIVVYVGHELVGGLFPFSWVWKNDSEIGFLRNHWTLTASNFIGACLWMIIAYVLFRKKIFIRI